MTAKDKTDYQSNREIVHVIREMEPARITAVSEALYSNTKVAFVVPAPPISRSFQRFMMSFENRLFWPMHNLPEYVTLLIILYPNTVTGPISKNVCTLTVQLVDLYRKKYPQAYTTRFQINAKLGYWMQGSYHLTCIYNEDLIKLLELSQHHPKLDLVDLIIQFGQLNIFRAADPGLVHLWQDGCKEYSLDQRGNRGVGSCS